MSQALRKLTAIVNKSKTCVIFINQLREKVGVMFGNPETTPGGKALKFYASMRLDVRRMDTLKDADGAMGNRTKAKVVKNKLAPPFKQAEFDIVFGEGISQEGCIIDMGVQFDVIGKSGSFYSYNGEKIAQGREKMRLFLKDNPEIQKEIEQKIRDVARGSAAEEV
jgi:recombination protein RecA